MASWGWFSGPRRCRHDNKGSNLRDRAGYRGPGGPWRNSNVSLEVLQLM